MSERINISALPFFHSVCDSVESIYGYAIYSTATRHRSQVNIFREPAIPGGVSRFRMAASQVLPGLGIEQTVLTDCDKGCIRLTARILGEWSATRKCALSSALFRRVEVPLALK